MVTYDQLAYIKLDQLDAAASSFEKLVRGWDLESDYESQVVRPLAGSDWTGPSADQAAGTLAKARTQISDAFDEASSLARVLRDLHDQLAAAQRTLRQIVSDAESQGLTVDDNGAVHWPPATSRVDRKDPEYASHFSQLASGIADRLTVVLQTATEADSAAAAAFAADTGSATTTFNAKPVGGISEQEAAQAAALAQQGGYLSDKQLSQLDALLKAHANDARFATAFYQKLGPKESLLFFGQLSWGSAGNGANPDPARLDLMKTLQTQMGVSLASATNLTGWPHLDQAWITGLHNAGTQQLQLDMNNPNDPLGKVYGYQILSNYLRTGNYNPQFLNPIAQDITDLSKADPTRWINQSLHGTNDRINFLDATAGFNPMTGVLDGLSHSPQAATDYFKHLDNLKYLASVDNSNVMLFTDTTGVGLDSYKAAHAAQMDAMSNALQAATSGMVPGTPDGTPMPKRTADMAQTAANIINTFGRDPSLLGGDFSQLGTTVSHITAAYIGDVDHQLNPNLIGPPPGDPSAQINATYATQLLHTLGRDPNSYGIVLQAQNAYTGALIQNYVQHHPNDPHLDTAVANIAQGGSVTNGILTQSRIDQITSGSAATDAKYNAAITRNIGIAKSVWSMTGGKLAGKIPLVGGYVNTGISDYINIVGKSYMHDHTAQAIQQSTDAYQQASNATQHAASLAVTTWYKGPEQSLIAQSAAGGAMSGFTAGDAEGTSTQGKG